MGFYVYLPSNTKGSNNTPASFTIQLPKKLEFHATWLVGCTGIMYTNSWVTMGTERNQSITIEWADGMTTKLMLPKTTYKTKEDLLNGLKKLLQKSNDNMCSIKKRTKRNISVPPDMFSLEKEINSSKKASELRVLIDTWSDMMNKKIASMTSERKKAEKSGIDITARKAFDVKEESRLSDIKKDMEIRYTRLKTQEEDEETELEYQKSLITNSPPKPQVSEEIFSEPTTFASVMINLEDDSKESKVVDSAQQFNEHIIEFKPIVVEPESKLKANDEPKPKPEAIIKPDPIKKPEPVIPEIIFSEPTSFTPIIIDLEQDPKESKIIDSEQQYKDKKVTKIHTLTSVVVPTRESQALVTKKMRKCVILFRIKSLIICMNLLC
uniref:Uncharacterized protein n=1 Tax=Ditylenchus dipsaci TaxID=166011 RepID=A0A915DPC6_9BILA